ncbi:MAG: hypothetical protein AJITA_00024 [Acetilactobacillus jinshanensis]
MEKSEQKNYLNEMNDAIDDLNFYLANQSFLSDLNQKDVTQLGKRFVKTGKLIQAVAKNQSK